MTVPETDPGLFSNTRHAAGLFIRALALVLMIGLSGVASMAGMDKDMQKTSFLKLSYVGIQDKPISTLLLLPQELSDPAGYVETAGLFNDADDFGFVQIVISPGTFSQLAGNVRSSLPATDPGVAGGPIIVSAFSHEDGSGRSWQVDDAAATRLFDLVSGALAGEAAAAEAFAGWRFRTNL